MIHVAATGFKPKSIILEHVPCGGLARACGQLNMSLVPDLVISGTIADMAERTPTQVAPCKQPLICLRSAEAAAAPRGPMAWR